MATAEAPTKKGPGNPAFTKKTSGWKLIEPTNPDKMYEFELINLVSQGKPVDRDNDKPISSPHQRLVTRPNEGMAYDEELGKTRAWRYIVGQPSIWADEQPALKDMDAKEINYLLGQSENQIEFNEGKCIVRGIDRLKLHALTLHDAFEGKPTQYRKVNRLYRLINPDKIIQADLERGELEFKASKLAFEATEQQMLQSAFTLGIDVSDISKEGINRIKAQFRNKAKYDPTNPKGLESLQFFIDVVENPMTKIKYIFSQAFTQGIISINQQEGKLTWALPNTVIMDLDPRYNAVDLLCAKVIEREELAMATFETIENELNNIK